MAHASCKMLKACAAEVLAQGLGPQEPCADIAPLSTGLSSQDLRKSISRKARNVLGIREAPHPPMRDRKHCLDNDQTPITRRSRMTWRKSERRKGLLTRKPRWPQSPPPLLSGLLACTQRRLIALLFSQASLDTLPSTLQLRKATGGLSHALTCPNHA